MNPKASLRQASLRHANNTLALDLPEAALDKLLAYLDLLLRWNKVYNLTALRQPDQVLSHHLLDCLAVLPPLRRWADGRRLNILDVGSGGGLPGVVLAIAQPDWRLDCVDSVAKKAGFIRQVAAELALPNLHSHHARVEAMTPDDHDLAISRAFASLADFTRLTAQMLPASGVWLAMKGQPSAAELAELPPDLAVFHVEQLAVPTLNAQRCLVWIRRKAAADAA